MFFLENADEMLTNQTETFAESINSVIEGSHAFTEATLQSELEYKDIMMEAVVNEAEAEKAEDEEKKKAGAMQNVANFFKKILEWVKKMFKKVKDFVTKTVSRLFSVSERAKRYVKKHEAEIKKVSSVTVNGITMLKNKPVVTLSPDAAANLVGVNPTENNFVEFTKSIKDQEVNVANAVKFIQSAQAEIAKVKSSGAAQVKALKETEDFAKKGLKAAKENGEKSAINEARQKVSDHRRSIQLTNRRTNLAVSAIARGLNDSVKVVKAAVKKAKASK